MSSREPKILFLERKKKVSFGKKIWSESFRNIKLDQGM